MKTLTGKRLAREYTMHLPFPAEAVFPLLCPVREYDWIPEWHCNLVYTESGYAELGAVFQTALEAPFGTETWVISQYEKNRCIAFVRTGEYRTTRYTITLTPDRGSTTLKWFQELTGLNPRGNTLLADIPANAFPAQMKKLEQLLGHYLSTRQETKA